MDDRIICDNVIKLRTALELTCEEFADLLDTKVSSYCRYELSLGFTLEELEILAKRMGVTIGVLLSEDSISSDDFLLNGKIKEKYSSALFLSDNTEDPVEVTEIELERLRQAIEEEQVIEFPKMDNLI